MSRFGEKLRLERESRGFSLVEVAEATRISRRYLEALEADDFPQLPGSVFNKGYVRAYAEFIGADPNGLVDAYVREEAAQEQAGRISNPDPLDGLRQAVNVGGNGHSLRGGFQLPRKAAASLLVTGVVLVAAFASYLWISRDGDTVGPSSGAPAAESEPPAESEVIPTKAEAPPIVEDSSPAREARQAAVDPPPPEATVAEVSKPSAIPPTPTPTPTKATAREAPAVAEPAPVTNVVDTAPTEATGEATMSVSEFGVGTGVVNRRLAGQSDQFEEGTRVHFWTRVIGGEAGQRIRHVWIREGRTVLSTELRIGGGHWRTHSRKTMLAGSVGEWAVEVHDPDGRVIAREEFRCTPAGSGDPTQR